MAQVKLQFTVDYQNVIGINTKFNQLGHGINIHNYDILSFMKTWCKEHREYFSQLSNSYEIFRKDRNVKHGKTKGGALVLLVRKDLQFRILDAPFLSLDVIHSYWIKL